MTGSPQPPRQASAPEIARRLGRWVELSVPTMGELRERRPILPPLLLGWILSVLATWTLAPLVGMALAEQLDGPTGGPTGVIESWMWLLAALAPLVQAGRALVWAVAAWALLTLAARDVSFRSLFSVFLYGEVLAVAYSVLLALYFQWVFVPGAADQTFHDPLSLARFVPSSHGVWGGVVEHLAVVHLGWTVFVAVAGHRVLGLDRREAWTLAATLWLGSVAVATTRILLNG